MATSSTNNTLPPFPDDAFNQALAEKELQQMIDRLQAEIEVEREILILLEHQLQHR